MDLSLLKYSLSTPLLKFARVSVLTAHLYLQYRYSEVSQYFALIKNFSVEYKTGWVKFFSKR